MRSFLIIFASVFLYSCQNPAPVKQELAENRTEITIGESVRFHSEILDEKRSLNIYLPLGYRDSSKSYPVIYLLDGGLDEDFIHIAGLVQFCSFSWINMIPESIVVGIVNVDRQRDFTYPTSIEKDKVEFPTTGRSGKFMEFLEREVLPKIESDYRVSEDKTLIGQSLGGLLATEILFTKPQLFDKYVIVSPSLWWDSESLFERIPGSFSSDKSIYIGVGKEGPIMESDAWELYQQVSDRAEVKESIHFQFFEAQNHGDVLHLAVYDSFEWLSELSSR